MTFFRRREESEISKRMKECVTDGCLLIDKASFK
jgi:hypothetical protein